ncbi:hypothetical protein HOLleu_21944 [Holothuria leucospilota]|uniref:Uncharacterized protein n=1 Tax=Holothuria leucospilota TaxID=206669 RepID=A0A9Q1H4C0_HOLLE|nr:hypothetical protein HOLleu_21944 [Holothuria leucospilota]
MSDPGSRSTSSRQRSSTEEDVSPLSSHELDSPFEVPALPDGIGLKPCLDSIFADVQANLPSIDFDLSDVSSDEDIQILTRSVSKVKTTKPRKKKLTPELWKNTVSSGDPVDISEEAGYEFQDPFSLSDKSTDGKDSGVSVSSSNGRSHRDVLSSGASSHHDEEEASFGGEAGQRTDRMISTSDSFSSQSDDDTLEVIEEIIGFKNIPLELNLGEDTAVVSGLETESGYPGINGRRATERKRRDNGQTSARRLNFEAYMPSGAPVLEMGPIDHIDLDLLLDAFPERNVPPTRGRNPYPLPTHGAGDLQQTEGICNHIHIQASILRKFYGCPLDNLSTFFGCPKENLVVPKETCSNLEAICLHVA